MDLLVPDKPPIPGQEGNPQVPQPPYIPVENNPPQVGISFDNIPAVPSPTGDFTKSPHYSGDYIVELERDNNPKTWKEWAKKYTEAAGVNTLTYSLLEHGLIKQKWNKELSSGNLQMVSVKDAKEKYDLDIKEPVPLGVAILMDEMKKDKIKKAQDLFGWDKPFESLAGFLYMGAIYSHMPESIAFTAAMSAGFGGIGWGLSSLAGSFRALNKINRLRKTIDRTITGPTRKLGANPAITRGETLGIVEATRPIRQAMRAATPVGAANAAEEYFIYESEKAKGFQYDPYTAVAFGAFAPFAFGSLAALVKGRQLRTPQKPMGQTPEPLQLPPGPARVVDEVEEAIQEAEVRAVERARDAGKDITKLDETRIESPEARRIVAEKKDAFKEFREDPIGAKARKKEEKPKTEDEQIEEAYKQFQGSVKIKAKAPKRGIVELLSPKKLQGTKKTGPSMYANLNRDHWRRIIRWENQINEKFLSDDPNVVKEGIKEVFGVKRDRVRPRGPMPTRDDIKKFKTITQDNYNDVELFASNFSERFAEALPDTGLDRPRMSELRSDLHVLLALSKRTLKKKEGAYARAVKFNRPEKEDILREIVYNKKRIDFQELLLKQARTALDRKRGRDDIEGLSAAGGFGEVIARFTRPQTNAEVELNNAITRAMDRYDHLLIKGKHDDLTKMLSEETEQIREFIGRLEFLEKKIPGINKLIKEVLDDAQERGLPKEKARMFFPYLDPTIGANKFWITVDRRLDMLDLAKEELTPQTFLSVERGQLDYYLQINPDPVKTKVLPTVDVDEIKAPKAEGLYVAGQFEKLLIREGEGATPRTVAEEVSLLNHSINKYLPLIKKREPILKQMVDEGLPEDIREFLRRLEYLETKIPGVNEEFSKIAGAAGVLGLPQTNVRAFFPFLEESLPAHTFHNMVIRKIERLKESGDTLSPESFLAIEKGMLDDYLSANMGDMKYDPGTSTVDAPTGKDLGSDVDANRIVGASEEIDTAFKKYVKCKKGIPDEGPVN